jgi:hypothetical protein
MVLFVRVIALALLNGIAFVRFWETCRTIGIVCDYYFGKFDDSLFNFRCKHMNFAFILLTLHAGMYIVLVTCKRSHMRVYNTCVVILLFGLFGASIVLLVCSDDLSGMGETLEDQLIFDDRDIPYLENAQGFINCSFVECCSPVWGGLQENVTNAALQSLQQYGESNVSGLDANSHNGEGAAGKEVLQAEEASSEHPEQEVGTINATQVMRIG